MGALVSERGEKVAGKTRREIKEGAVCSQCGRYSVDRRCQECQGKNYGLILDGELTGPSD